MGLAASQARLLSITSRKSEAQNESMRLSHQKLALSRSLTDVSNEYQNALNKTKLCYDFYGNGATDNILSYNLLMSPSFINEYTPVLITNQQNRIVLSSNLAAAARAAGIPEEGLDGYIDTVTRNKFINILSGLGEIDAPTADVIMDTEYNPNVGLGESTGVYVTTEYDNYSVLERRFARTRLSTYDGLNANDLKNPTETTSTGIMACVLNTTGSTPAQNIKDTQVQRLSDTQSFYFCKDGGESFGTSTMQWNSLSLYDILYGDDIILTQNVQRGTDVTDALNPTQYDDMINVVQTVIDLLADEIEDAYGFDESVAMAINQAYINMNAACWSGGDELPKLAVSTLSSASYRTDIDAEGSACWAGRGYMADTPDPTWTGTNVQNHTYVIGYDDEETAQDVSGWYQFWHNATYGEDGELYHGRGNLLLNYKDDELELYLPSYAEWNGGWNAETTGFEHFKTAEDNPYSRWGGSYDFCYEPGAFWVSLPNGVASGNTMQYIAPVYDGQHDYFNTTSSPKVVGESDGVYNDLKYNDINIYDYYGLTISAEEWKAIIEAGEDLEENIEGNGVNISRRNAMVNAIDGAKNNLALFNLYDYTGEFVSSTDGNAENKNFGGNYGSINLSAFVQAWYTYFMQSLAASTLNDDISKYETEDEYNAAMATANGILYGDDATNIRFHSNNGNSSFVTATDEEGNLLHDLSSLQFAKADVMVDDGIADIACFYDTIINQICEYGWTENNQVKEDTSYLQEMLQSGQMFLFKLANDSYYYQTNYSTDTFVKEVADETAIAEAEAKYRTQKSRINSKEEEIDLKMRNLDTEISALESEYEAVKKVISSHVQRAFSRYQA